MPTDTIAAIATPAGRGGIGILRLSGPQVPDYAQALLHRLPSPRRAEFLPFHGPDGEVIDRGIALYFPAPASFTGEHILELQAHGGPVVMDRLLAAAVATGARQAGPGEFSQRAFLNERIDLAQAEAIADLIDADSIAAARSAQRSLSGEFSTWIQSLIEGLINLRVYVESSLDFAEEEIDFLAEARLEEQLQDLMESLQGILEKARQGSVLREGLQAAIVGPPNAGKSSLLNRLSGRESAIVTDIPGTTRDLLRESVVVAGIPLHLIDTAGLRDSDDPVEKIGIERAHQTLRDADLLLWVEDPTEPAERGDDYRAQMDPAASLIHIFSKSDQRNESPGLVQDGGGFTVHLSARTGAGLDDLETAIKQSCGYVGGDGIFAARRRHLEALRKAEGSLNSAQQHWKKHGAGELLAEDLRKTQDYLSEIGGRFSSDDLLGRIFSDFCIGK